MAKQFENSSTNLIKAPSGQTVGILIVLLTALQFAVLVMSLDNVVPAVLIAVSIAIVLYFAFYNFSQSRRLAATSSLGSIEWNAALPEIQRQNLNVEVSQLAKILGTGTEHRADLQSAYIVAEDLALRQIQQEEKVPLLRHISVCNVPFNAVLVKDDILICAEVSFLISPEFRQDKIDSMLRKIETVRNKLNELSIEMRARLMLILITQLSAEDGARLRSTLGKQRFASASVDIEMRLLDFESLQAIYITD